MGGGVHAARQAALVTHSFRAGARACVVLCCAVEQEMSDGCS